MEEELIDHISKQLRKHEEPYAAGAWERFSDKKEKNRRIVYWPIGSVAALLLVFLGLYFGLRENKNGAEKITGTKETLTKPNVNTPDQPVENSVAIPAEKPVTQVLTKNNSASFSSIKKNLTGKNVQISLENTGASYPAPANSGKNTEQPFQAKPADTIVGADNTLVTVKTTEAVPLTEQQATAKNSFEDLLAKDSAPGKQNSLAKNSKLSKWQPDLYVSTSMGNDSKVNLNYGFSISYAVADKLSLGSGIAYNTLSSASTGSTAGNANVQSMPATFASAAQPNSKSLESVQAQVKGITIPLDLKYSLSNKVYATVGVSALAVLNNHLQNNYLSSSVENRQVVSAAGITQQKTLIVKELVSEPATESASGYDKYLGFYNFSIGYKQKISGKNSIAFEPFLSLPMKNFSKDNINLTNGGFKLKVSF